MCEQNCTKSGENHEHTIESIKFHPMRYVLIDEKLDRGTQWGYFLPKKKTGDKESFFALAINKIIEEKNLQTTVKRPDNYMGFSDKSYGLSFCKPGWIYVHNETTNIWYEYELKDDGKLYRCVWTKNETGKDYRPANDSVVKRHLTLDKKCIYQISYSEIQWSWSYYKKMYDSKAERDTKMQTVNVSEYLEKGESKHLFSSNKYAVLLGALTNKDMFDLNKVIVRYLKNLKEDADERFGDQIISDGNVPNWHYIGIEDPMAIADQLSEDLKDQFKLMELTIQSVQTGKSPQHIAHFLKPGQDATSLVSDKKHLAQIDALNKMATMLYQTGFSSTQLNDKFGKHLNQTFIEKILAVESRRDIRVDISFCKKRLYKFLEKTPYGNELKIMQDNGHYGALHAKIRLMEHLTGLGTPIDGKDRMWILPNEYSFPGKTKLALYVDNQVQDFLQKILDGTGATGELFYKKIKVDPLKVEEVPQSIKKLETAVKVADLVGKIFTNFAKIGARNKKALQNIIGGLNAVSMAGFNFEHMFEGVDIKKYFTGRKQPLLRLPENFNSQMIRDPEKGMVILYSEEFLSACNGEGNDLYRSAEKLTNNLEWEKAMRGMAYVNAILTINSMIGKDKWDTGSEAGKNLLSISSGVIDLWAAHHSVKTFRVAASGASDDVVTAMTKSGAKANAATAFIGAAVSTVDCGVNVFEGDLDAGIAYGIGGAIGVLTGIGILNAWNPLGLLALAVAGFAAGIVAIFLEDPPIERFVKNCPLRKNIDKDCLKIIESDRPPYMVVNEITSSFNREKLDKWGWGDAGIPMWDSDIAKWDDFTKAVKDLEKIFKDQKEKAEGKK